METALVLGADCGGTSSRVVVATVDGRVVGRGRGGAGNPVARDARAAAAALGHAAAEALRGLDPARVTAAVVGMAGWSRLAEPPIAAGYAEVWAALGVRCRVRAVGDAVVAFAAGTSEPDGSVLIAGTGAVAASLTGRTVTRTADGLGWLLGDEGSGFWLGLAAARRTARALYAGDDPGPLGAAVRAALGGADPDAFVARVHAVSRSEIAALASLVTECAREGDPEARAIVADAAGRLAGTLASLPPGPGPVVLAGGLLGAPEVREEVQARLTALLGRPGVPAGDGAVGAAWLAASEVTEGDPTGTLHASMFGREALSTADPA